MATGVPISSHGANGTIHLEYAQKRDIADILKPQTVKLEALSQSSSNKRLYFGENFDILHALRQDLSVCGKVKLIYIDPPYATQTAFYSRQQKHAYTDNLGRTEYVNFLRERLVLLHSLLSKEGSIYLHLDEKMVFEMKLVMDEIFGANNYRNMIVRKKCNPKNYTRKTYGNMADFILFYTKSDQYTWNRPVENLSAESKKEYQYIEEETGRRYMRVPIHAPGIRNGETGKPWRGMMPPLGKHWQYTPAKLDEMDARGEIYWSKNGNPRRKVYLDQHSGVGVQNIWLDFKDAHNQNIKITGYPTEKNPELLKRIILASSNPDDLVLDCFAGSGTTLSVAEETGRQWIGIDNSPEAISTVLKRFKKGLQVMGDFVNKPTSKLVENIQIALFEEQGDLETLENLPSEKKHVKRIEDFNFLATSHHLDMAKKLIDK